MTDLSKLIERLKAATGPDLTLDFDLLEIAGLGYSNYTQGHYEYQDDKPDYLDVTRRWWQDKPTSSVDASLALVERLLPNARWAVETIDRPRGFMTTLSHGAGKDFVQSRDASPTAPLAILLALLTALQSKDETNVEGV